MDARIGVLIRKRRLALELRQEDLARVLEITAHQLQKYETGENRIAASRLVECARALDVPVAWFYQSTSADENTKAQSETALTGGEHELVERYRQLSAEGRAQLIGISKLLQNEGGAKKHKTRRT